MESVRTPHGKIQKIVRQDRTCGNCRLCCKLLAVGREELMDDFKKPQGEWCYYSSEGGCSIYDARPVDCAEYWCTWLRGVFPEDCRPDRVKVVISLEEGKDVTDDAGNVVFGPSPVWCVYESYPGTSKTGRAARIVEELESIIIEIEKGEYTGPLPV